MMGGRRVVRVRGAGNDLADLLESFLDDPKGDALVVIEAGDLAKTGALRKLFDGHKTAAAMQCYPDSVRDLGDVVRDALRAEGLSIAPDALEDAVSRLGSDRGVTRREIEKLLLYMHGQKQVALEDVRAVMGDEAEARSESACDAAGSGDLAKLDRELERLWVSDTQPAQVLRSAMGHFQRLVQARESADARRKHRHCDEAAAPAGAFLPRHRLQEPGPALEQRQAGRGAGHAAGCRSPDPHHRRSRRSGDRPRLDEHRRHGEGPNVMLKVRVIPCLDVKDGRVVKGVNFEGLRDAGDPVEQAILYDKAGADELCFLDITASHENRGTLLDVVHRTAEVCFMPLTVGGGVRTLEDIRALLLAGADKVSINTAAVSAARNSSRKRRRNSAANASSPPSTPRRREQRQLRDLHPWRAQGHRHRCGGTCQKAGRLWRGRNPAHLHGPRRGEVRL